MQEKILQTAKELFIKHGIRRVSIDDICQELHISKKTFYVYYSSKEELLDATLTYLSCRISENQVKCFSGKNPIEVFSMIANHITEFVPHNTGTPIWFDLHKYYPKIAEKHERINSEKLRASLGDYLRKGQQDGYFREDLNIDMFISFFEGMHLRMRDMVEQGGLDVEDRHYGLSQLASAFMDIFTHTVLKDPSQISIKK